MSISKLFLSAGAMKAGTSYLYKMLEKHPGIETTPIKEIHYFAHHHTPLSLLDDSARMHNLKTFTSYIDPTSDVAAARRSLSFFSRYLRPPTDDAWYEDLFESNEAIWKADFSNMACLLPDSGLRHICRVADDIRVIYLLRDPLKRLWSHVRFHAAVNDEVDIMTKLNVDQFESYLLASGALAQGRYADNFARMRHIFNEERMKIIFFEDLISEPQRALETIFRFLDLDPIRIADADLREVHNPSVWLDMPAPFFAAAARPFVEAEITEMRAQCIPVHPDWCSAGSPAIRD